MYRSKHLTTSSPRWFNYGMSKSSGKCPTKRAPIAKPASREASTSSTSSGNGFYFGASAGVVGAMGAGAVMYAKYDDDVRKTIETYAPFTRNLFVSLFGEMKKKEISMPLEKDLSLYIPNKDEAWKDIKPTPIIAEDEVKVSSDSVALNALDTPAISAIDIELSSLPSSSANDKPLKAVADSEKTPLYTVSSTELMTSEEIVVEAEDVSGEVITERTAEIANDTMPVIQEKTDLTAERVIADKAPGSVNEQIPASEDKIDEIQVPDGPLTPEEVKMLSELVDPTALEVVLSASAENMKMLSEASVYLHQQAAESIHNYMKHFSELMHKSTGDVDYQEVLKLTSEAEKFSQETIDAATQKAIELKTEIAGLKELMGSIRQSGYDEIADKTDEFLNACHTAFEAADQKLAKAGKDLKVLLELGELVEKSPVKLKEMLKKYTPNLVKVLMVSEEAVEEATPEGMLLQLALKLPEVMESQVSDENILTSKRFDELMEKQKEDVLKASEEKLTVEVQRIKEEFAEEHNLKLKNIEEEYEKEMLAQLKRQASAHNAHLTESLETQASETNVKYQKKLEERLKEQQEGYEFELGKNVASIHGIESKIEEIADVELRQRRVHQLWVATQALNASLTESLFHGRTRILMPEMLSIMTLGGQNEVLREIVESVPEVATMFGVVPEKELIQRFKHVKNVCKKVALVGEEGGSMGTYFISYIKSLFVYSGWYQSDVLEPVNLENIGPYEILAKADYFIQEGDLEQAAKFMSQLKGASRKLASDWLNEVRLFLETKQTAQLLLTYASSLSAAAK